VRALRSRYLLIVVVGFIVLVFAYSTIYVSLDYDNCVYYYLAKRIAEGAVPYTDFTLFKTPLYPYLLALVFLVAGPGFPQILMTNVAIGVLTLVGLYRLGKALHTPATGVLAALVYAAAYFSVYLHAIGKTEPLFNLLLVYALLALVTPPPTGRRLHGLASPLLLALAFFTLPRASLPALGGIVLTLLTTAPRRHALRYLGLFTLFAAALSAPFLLLAPTEFLYNVFLFNALRGFQSTPGVAASIQWLLERGSLTLFAFGTLGLLLAALHAWHRLPTPLRPLAPRLHPQHATLLVSLFLLFWAILALPQFAYPYMIYPVWPLLATGAALLIAPLLPIPLTAIVGQGQVVRRQRSVQRVAPVLLILLFLATIVVDSGAMVLTSVMDQAWSRDRETGLAEVADFIHRNLEGADLVLSFDPGLSIRFLDRLVLPPDHEGGSLDLINYFPYRAFSLLMANNTDLNPVRLWALRDELEATQRRIQAHEFSALLSQATILVFDGEAFLSTYFPDVEGTLKPVIAARCRLLQTFGTMTVYRVEA
jgi:4-amino-4-deoxy-L-arabinose transferase-like glycosyltransferase